MKWFVALLCTCFISPAIAGRACEQTSVSPENFIRALTLAERAYQQLQLAYEQNNTKVVVIARAGQDLTKYGLRYSHLGWAYRSNEGKWKILHKLNHCGTAESAIYLHGLAEFFLDDLWRYEAVWSELSPQLQTPMLGALNDSEARLKMHEPAYSMVSYPWATRYQQSNQWAIETLALAAELSIKTRAQAQAWLKFKDYNPSMLQIGTMTRLGARVGMANVAFDDHPNQQRFAGQIETVTVDSVLKWLETSGMAGKPKTIGR